MTWWLQGGWTDAKCAECGRRIHPEGDPDWGYCYDCFTRRLARQQKYPEPMCDICGEHPAVAGVNGYDVCSEACDYEATRRIPRAKGADR